VIRRSLLLVVTLVGALTLSACTTFTDNDAIARVNDVELARADLERFIQEVIEANPNMEGTDVIEGDAYRSLITDWIVDELVRQQLEELGVEISPDDLASATATVDQQIGGVEVSDFVREFLISSAATRNAFQRTQGDGSLAEFAERADVIVDSRYGYWDTTQFVVLPLG
jgi:hypothetical protein